MADFVIKDEVLVKYTGKGGNVTIPGGVILADSTLIGRKVTRDDVTAFYVPATKMAKDIDAPTLANMILIGKFLREVGAVGYDNLEETLKKVISARHRDLLAINRGAIDAGYNFV